MRCLLRTVFLILILAALAALAVCGFYAEENARGAHEWTDAERSLRDRGESHNFDDLIPPTIPENQNLAAIPLFQTEINAEDGNSRQAVALKNALSNIIPKSATFPIPGNWLKAEKTDMLPIKKYLTDRYQQVFGQPESGLGAMEEIDALCPALNDLRKEAITRPLVRFDRDYTTQPPYDRALSPVTQLISLTRVLNLHAIAALSEGKPDIALNDIQLTLRLSKGVALEPVLISGLVSIAMLAIQGSSIWEGLDRHAWNAHQLNDLQTQLQEIDFISDYQLCVRGEATGFFAQTNDWMRDHRRSATECLFGPVIQLITGADDNSLEKNSNPSYAAKFIGWLVPRGWFDMSKARGVSLYYQAARELADPNTHRIYAGKADQFKQKIQSLSRWDLPDLLLRISAPPVVNSVSKFAEAQFRIDAAWIACALEKYRLANVVYPNSLSKLESPPLDPITGESYHFKLLPAGNFLLYSVGWNQIDDGGTFAFKTDKPESVDWEHGDWVWPSR
jgi:hypothetical protein